MSADRPRQDDQHHTTDENHHRGATMSIHEELVRTQLSERLGEAHELSRGHRVSRAQRFARRAERVAGQARLALARSL